MSSTRSHRETSSRRGKAEQVAAVGALGGGGAHQGFPLGAVGADAGSVDLAVGEAGRVPGVEPAVEGGSGVFCQGEIVGHAREANTSHGRPRPRLSDDEANLPCLKFRVVGYVFNQSPGVSPRESLPQRTPDTPVAKGLRMSSAEFRRMRPVRR